MIKVGISDLNEYKRVTTAFVKRNRIILTNTTDYAVAGEVNLNWWKQKFPGGGYNLGDYLSFVIFKEMLNRKNIESLRSVDGTIKHLYGLGSIIDGGYQDATVWGSGVLSDRMFWWRRFRKLDVRCVRGPITREVLRRNGYSAPSVYGDPGILMPLLYKPETKPKSHQYGVVHHCIVDKEDNDTGLYPIDIKTNDYKQFIEKICSCELILSSSLHGIILAESYGVPAVLLHEGGLSLTKFYDYYYSTGREKFPIVDTIHEAVNTIPPELPQLNLMREKLIELFPYDLFSSGA